MIKVKSKPKENANTVRKKNRWKDFRDNAELSALMIPGIVLLLVFAYVPMLGIIIAFKDYRNNLGIFKSKWGWISKTSNSSLTSTGCLENRKKYGRIRYIVYSYWFNRSSDDCYSSL